MCVIIDGHKYKTSAIELNEKNNNEPLFLHAHRYMHTYRERERDRFGPANEIMVDPRGEKEKGGRVASGSNKNYRSICYNLVISHTRDKEL